MSSATVEVLHADSPSDYARWESIVDSAPLGDVYYRPGYVRAHQVAGHGRAVALLVRAGDKAALFPLLLRDLAELPFAPAPSAVDAITAYGYGGLLPLGQAPAAEELRPLFESLRSWGRDSAVVSCLFRLHPLLVQEKALASAAVPGLALHQHGPTTAIDVLQHQGPTAPLAGMSKGRRSDLSLAARKLRVSFAEPGALRDSLQLFRTIYEHTMDRLQAGAFYHFPLTYYEALAEGLHDRLQVATAWFGEQAVAAALFMAGRSYAHYHLSGATDAGRECKASTLLITAGAYWARLQGCHMLHLGGGTRGDDPLFAFKKSFGGPVYTYSYATFVVNDDRYAALVTARESCSTLPPPRPGYFPRYRA